jgi:hypothetical protein
MDWIDVAQDMDQWRAVVNMVMNLGFRKLLGNSWVAEQLAASQEERSSIQLVRVRMYKKMWKAQSEMVGRCRE